MKPLDRINTAIWNHLTDIVEFAVIAFVFGLFALALAGLEVLWP